MIAKDKCSVISLSLDPNASIAKELGCVLNNEETSKPVIKLRYGAKKRRKRDAGKKGKSDEKLDKTKASKTPVYGCPTNYERIIAEGIDLCFRFGEHKTTKKDLITEFDEAKNHCEQDGGALLYFSNYNEALNIWKWLGRNDECTIQSI